METPIPTFDIEALWDFNDPAASEARFRGVLADLSDPTEPAVAIASLELLTQIARAQGLGRRFDDAHATLDDVERTIAAEEKAAIPRVRVRYLLERGRVLNSSGKKDEARPYFVEAFDRALLDEDDPLAVDAAHMVAIVESPEGAMLWNERALALAESSSHPRARKWRASLLNNMGWTRHDRGEFDVALDLFERALEARREQSDPGTIRIARWSVARCLRSLGRTEEALAAQQGIERELSAAGDSDGYVNEEIAECLLALDRATDARPQFARAAELLGKDSWFVEREPARLARLRQLGSEPAAS
ncbi:MAG: tetratricopeptide repeat protein [Candidatus Eiseniibacteriota bacterium]